MSDLIDRQAAIDALDCINGAEEVLRALPSAQPEILACGEGELNVPDTNVGDMISRQAAIEALARMMPRSYTPDGSHPADEEIYKAQEIYADCIESIEILPAVQPEIIRCKDCKHRHVENMVWTCPFGLSGGENFFCGYGTEPYKGNDMQDLISRQAESNPLEKCYTCKHVYQRVSDADTLYCRCRKGCRYEKVKPRRSDKSPRRHEG